MHSRTNCEHESVAQRDRFSPNLFAIAMAVASALGVACRGPEPQAPARPDLVLISLDTFRADLLDLTRSDGSPELPTLRRLAADSIRFDNAWSPQPFTLPSHMTMLTGLHPEAHGVIERGRRLAAGVPTIAERLHDAGYRTAGVGCGVWLSNQFGFGRGFDDYRVVSLKLTFADRVRARALDAVAHLPDDGRPRFLFAHFYDAHGDWTKQGNKLSYFSPPEQRADLTVPDEAVCPAAGDCAVRFLVRAAHRTPRPTADFTALHFELYRRSARELDAQLALFFDELRRLSLWDDAAVILTADHGEEFFEHGRFTHSQVFRETLHVPLLVRLPHGARGGTKESRPVSLEDVAPTLLALAGAPAAPGFTGFDLLSPPRSRAERPFVARENLPQKTFALRLGNRLFVRDLKRDERRLFDLERDPGEHLEAASDPAAMAAFAERLDAALRNLRARGVAPERFKGGLNAREDADLRALGYLN